MPETYLSPVQAADHLNIGITLFYQLRKEDGAFPPAIPLGRCRRYSESDLDAYMQAKKEKLPAALAPDPDLDREAAEIILKHRRPKIVSE